MCVYSLTINHSYYLFNSITFHNIIWMAIEKCFNSTQEAIGRTQNWEVHNCSWTPPPLQPLILEGNKKKYSSRCQRFKKADSKWLENVSVQERTIWVWDSGVFKVTLFNIPLCSLCNWHNVRSTKKLKQSLTSCSGDLNMSIRTLGMRSSYWKNMITALHVSYKYGSMNSTRSVQKRPWQRES